MICPNLSMICGRSPELLVILVLRFITFPLVYGKKSRNRFAVALAGQATCKVGGRSQSLQAQFRFLGTSPQDHLSRCQASQREEWLTKTSPEVTFSAVGSEGITIINNRIKPVESWLFGERGRSGLFIASRCFDGGKGGLFSFFQG